MKILFKYFFAWVQRKLGELLSRYKEFALKDGTYPHVSLTKEGVVPKTARFERDFLVRHEDKQYRVTHLNDICYNPANLKFGVICRNTFGIGIFSPIYVTYQVNAKFTPEFVESLVTRVDFVNQALRYQEGTVYERMSVNPEDFEKMDIQTPSIEEQTKIATLLSTLDKLVTLRQRKLELLQSLKKAMLQQMFPDKGKDIPQLRFKGFNDTWEQRKLGDFVEFFSGLTYTPSDVQENGTLVLRSSNVHNGEIVDADNVYVNPQVVNSENVKVGDIIVVVRNGSRSLIGKHAQVKASMPNTVIGAFMAGIRSGCSEFTNALLNTVMFEEQIAMNMGATINQITGYMFSTMKFAVPCVDEQERVGAYFSNLDNLITLHQRELDRIEQLKKFLLQQMFV